MYTFLKVRSLFIESMCFAFSNNISFAATTSICVRSLITYHCCRFYRNLLVSLTFSIELDVIGSAWTFGIFLLLCIFSLFFVKVRKYDSVVDGDHRYVI